MTEAPGGTRLRSWTGLDEVVKSLRPVLDATAPPPLRILGTAARGSPTTSSPPRSRRWSNCSAIPTARRPTPRVGPPGDWWNAMRAALDAGQQDATTESARYRGWPGSAGAANSAAYSPAARRPTPADCGRRARTSWDVARFLLAQARRRPAGLTLPRWS
jgi:hypothetical protein